MFTSSCSQRETHSIYESLEGESDGVIATDLDGLKGAKVVEPAFIDVLSPKEKFLVDELHDGKAEEISFILVNSKTHSVLKSYQSLQPRKLASVSKIATSLAALENVNGVNVGKIASMLKSSNNGEASRYGRLAAKAIDGTRISTPSYTEAHSCPRQVYGEGPIGQSILGWVTGELPGVDWTDSDLEDAAGCMHANQMSTEQTIHILDYAQNQGAVYSQKSFVELLAVAGQDGTLMNRNQEHKGMIFAKTGTLTPVSNLAGYVHVTRNGEVQKYYFAIFVEKKGNGIYTTRARELIEGFVRLWVNQLLTEEPEALYRLDL